jgi:hypothetical protein
LGIRRTTQQDLQDVKKAISVELLPSNPSAEALRVNLNKRQKSSVGF